MAGGVFGHIEDQDRTADIAKGEAAGLRKGAKQRETLEQRIHELELALRPFSNFELYAGDTAFVGKRGTRVTRLDFERARQTLKGET